jgi:cis-3-alkyl-4-acyloxetan-2-one decarboxylase
VAEPVPVSPAPPHHRSPAPPLYSDFPFTARTFDRTGLNLSYLDEGAGDPVVMLHGNPTWSYYFRNLVLALRDRYRCIVPDHIGCGLSDKPPVSLYDYSLKSRIDDVEALLDHCGVREKVTLVLHDWGGMIGMGYAARHPGRIARIIATNTGCTRLPAGKRFPWLLRLGRNTRLGARLILKRNAFCRAAAKWCVTRKPLPPDVRDMYLKPYDTPEHRVAVLKFVQTIPLNETDPGFAVVRGVEESLPKFRDVPTLLLWGMRDFVFDRHFLAEWQKHFPQAETHTWPDSGHYLLEDAGPEAIPKVVGFFRSHPIGDGPQNRS